MLQLFIFNYIQLTLVYITILHLPKFSYRKIYSIDLHTFRIESQDKTLPLSYLFQVYLELFNYNHKYSWLNICTKGNRLVLLLHPISIFVAFECRLHHGLVGVILLDVIALLHAIIFIAVWSLPIHFEKHSLLYKICKHCEQWK